MLTEIAPTGARMSSFSSKGVFFTLYQGVGGISESLPATTFGPIAHLHLLVLMEPLLPQRHWECWHERWGSP